MALKLAANGGAVLHVVWSLSGDLEEWFGKHGLAGVCGHFLGCRGAREMKGQPGRRGSGVLVRCLFLLEDMRIRTGTLYRAAMPPPP